MSLTLVRSPVFDVEFAGWRATSTTLQACGWQMAVSEDPCFLTTYVRMFHPDLGVALDCEGVAREELVGRCIRDLHVPNGGQQGRLVVRVRRAFHKDCQVIMAHHTGPWTPFDARPEVLSTASFSFEDLTSMFRPIAVPEEKELIVEPQTVSYLLDQILHLQKDDQAELRRKARRDQARQVHAQIVSLAA